MGYPNLSIATCLISIAKKTRGLDEYENIDSINTQSNKNAEYELPQTKNNFIDQNELNDLIRVLDLLKIEAELLSSRLQQWILLAENTTATSFCSWQKNLTVFFSLIGDLSYCSDIN